MRASHFLRNAACLLAAARLLCAAAPQGRTVSLYVTVEKGGGLVTGLTEKNFRLYEDGQPKPFRLEPPETPATIALLVEHSQASWPYLNDIAQSIEGFFREAPEGNWYALATFSNQLKVEVDFTKMRGRILEAFSELGQPLWDAINTYDAVWEMLDKMGRLPGRRVLIFIGSGYDDFSAYTLDEVRRKVEQTNVVIYALGAGSMLRGSYEPYLGNTARMNLYQAEAFLRMLADKSGGQAWFPRFETAYRDAMRGIMQSLAAQYRLVYESTVPRDGRFHKIKVEAFQVVNDRREDFRVRAREGWRY
ncbi:MAG TPA: VWA domain-containing protein [Bryobacteraceae bacterium]|nr:VWA domain-containing protein [Bryobacteraceae bacterium]